MPNSDFGLVRDPIQSVTQVSPTVAGGQTTYRMTFFSGKTFDFNVYNGANGYGQIRTQTFQNITSQVAWANANTFIYDNFRTILASFLVLKRSGGGETWEDVRRLHCEILDDNAGTANVYYSNGDSGSSPYTLNDPRKVYDTLFINQTSAGELWNCDVIVLYLDTTIQPPSYPTLSSELHGTDIEIKWQGNWMLERCTLAFYNLSSPNTTICKIEVLWDGTEYVCTNKTYPSDADYVNSADVVYDNALAQNIYVETTADQNNQFVFDPAVHGFRIDNGYFGRMDAGFSWQL